MSCFSDCTRDTSQVNRNIPMTNSQPIKIHTNTSNKELNFDVYMTKKITHALPTIKESYDDDDEEEEEEIKTRKTKNGKKIPKKRPILIENNKKHLFYEYKEQLICFFCGGESCKHENWKLHKNPAIRGLNSDKITEDIFASQRLSNRLIYEYDLIKTFKSYIMAKIRMNIGLIINLQRQGEHPYCGDKLDLNSGFSYDPQILISEDIKYFNFGWEDMSIPDSMEFMVNIMKEMLITIKEDKKKVLIHCHAGYGRTGIVIACYMIMDSNRSADDIVTEIRSKRSSCIQKSTQMDYCKQFREYIDFNRCIYTRQVENIDFFLRNQKILLFGEEEKNYKNVPKIFVKLINRIIELKIESNYQNSNIYRDLYYLEFWDEDLENKICNIKKEINKWDWSVIDSCFEIPLLIQLLYDWIGDCLVSLIPAQKIFFIYEKISENDLKKDTLSSDKIERSNLCLKLKSFLKSGEFECLVYIATLINKILPTKKEDHDIFNRVMEKILLSVSGINARRINYRYGEINKNIPDEITDLFRKFNILINFLCYVISNDFETGHLALLHQTISQINQDFYSKDFTLNIDLNNLKTNNKGKVSSTIEADNLKDHKERDKNMFHIYQMLNQYFKTNNINIEEDPIFFEKDNIELGNDEINNPKSKTLRNIKEIDKNENITNDNIVNLFENFENFMKIQNLPKTSRPGFRSKASIVNDNISNSNNYKNEMQIIMEDPDSNKNFKIDSNKENKEIIENKDTTNGLFLSSKIILPKLSNNQKQTKVFFGYKFFKTKYSIENKDKMG